MLSTPRLAASGYGQSAEAIIGALVRLVKKLSPDAGRMWREAAARKFDIGIRSQITRSFELSLKAATIAAIASVQAELVFTIYAPEPPSTPANR